jgi:hypothetical protein
MKKRVVIKKKILTIMDNAIYYMLTYKDGSEQVVKEDLSKVK